MPSLYIITGSNGAGKSSIGPEYIPFELRKLIFDGDLLFMKKKSELWSSGIRPHKECKKLAAKIVQDTFDDLVNISLTQNNSFAYEGHFTNNATWDIPKKFKAAGYEINLIFFGLTDIRLSEIRVVARANEGGHYVDPLTLQTNFYGNLEKLCIYFEIFNSIEIYDTSSVAFLELVKIINGIPVSAVSSNDLPFWFTKNLKRITAKIVAFHQ